MMIGKLMYCQSLLLSFYQDGLFSISLETWFRRSRTCPTCRVACPLSIKLYFSDAQESVSNDNIHAVKVSQLLFH